MAFHDIFSNEKIIIEKYGEVVIDIHEKNSLVPSILSKLKIPYRFDTLEVGDYLVGETLIERKTFNDFLSSIISKRLFNQLKNLNQSNSPLLIIEDFDFNYSKRSIHENAIRGSILSISTEYKIPIIYSKNSEDTAIFLSILSKKQEGSKNISRLKKIPKNLEEKKRFILEGFPGIGPVISKKLIEKYKILKEIFNLEKEKLREIEKFDENKIEEFKKILET